MAGDYVGKKEDELYMQQDVWDFFDLNLYKNYEANRRRDPDHGHVIDFTPIKWKSLREEAKLHMREMILSGVRTIPYLRSKLYSYRILVRFLANLPHLPSLLSKPLLELRREYITFIKKNTRSSVTTLVVHLDAHQQRREYIEDNPVVMELKRLYHFLEKERDKDLPENQKDIWEIEKLGLDLKIRASRPRKKIVFTGISQPQIREAAKKYVWIRLQSIKVSAIFDCIKAIRDLSTFLARHHPQIQSLTELNRLIIEEFFQYLEQKGYSMLTRASRKGQLRTFFNLLNHYDIEGAPNKTLIIKGDVQKKSRFVIKAVPEDVIRAFNRHIDELPQKIRTAMMILESVGMRINEVCELNWDCLKKDATGEFFLEYYQTKTDYYGRVPISSELVHIIQAQQKSAREKYHETPYLLPMDAKRPIAQGSITYAINRLAYKYSIVGPDGKLFRFQAHMFRHTVATRYAKEGMSPYMIRSMLGHKSIISIAPYIELKNTIMNDKISSFLADEEKNLCQWLGKDKNGTGIPLINGWCDKPEELCETAMLCYSCGMFQMDSLDQKRNEEYRFQVLDEAKRARLLGHERQAEILMRLAGSIGNALEKGGR